MANINLETQIGDLLLRNPVLTASGTFGYGEEIADFVDLNQLGGIICKTVTRQPREGNAPPRTCETTAGMLNAIGLQNVGIDAFIREKMPYLRGCGTSVIVNVAGESVEEFAFLCQILSDVGGISAIELNISCPNVAHGLDFATDPQITENVVSHCRKATSLPIWVKLSPNVTNIADIARAAEQGGADALCVCNTFVGMAIDINAHRPRLSNGTGGLSGPAIKPLALRAVWQCAGAVKTPIIGIGGISTPSDAIEFLLAGARAIQVGTATFVRPDAATKIVHGIALYLEEHKMSSPLEIVGLARRRKEL